MSTRAKRILAALVSITAVLPLLQCGTDTARAVLQTRELAAQALPRAEYRLDRVKDSTQLTNQLQGIAAAVLKIDGRTARLSCQQGNRIDCEDPR